MIIHKTGDHGTVHCCNCKAKTPATYKRLDITSGEQKTLKKGILCLVCDVCFDFFVVAPQSAPASSVESSTKDSSTEKVPKRASIEFRVPSHLCDILYVASYNAVGTASFSNNVLKYYLCQASRDKNYLGNTEERLTSPILSGTLDGRISFKGRRVTNHINKITKNTKLTSKTQILKLVVLKIYDDLVVNRDKQAIYELNTIYESTC
ncbi:hypothetical protein [Vibrio sp. D431a]|uniref:hypothetical protein n=1 Tax=Vibrio sp. D431a TaxID=2837388 RepID=UPI002555BB1E|nr:hypothetical protein [Vibrio sp. D431a]MDK9790022.1 hypothetical protein [Vibrio sp. D431a]